MHEWVCASRSEFERSVLSLQDKLAEADENSKKKDVPLGMLKADGSSKRSRTFVTVDTVLGVVV
jgi:hypothetical protein